MWVNVNLVMEFSNGGVMKLISFFAFVATFGAGEPFSVIMDVYVFLKITWLCAGETALLTYERRLFTL